MLIKKISSLEILDSRGFPTLKTTLELDDGITGTATVPSGASTGTYEAHELRDNDLKRFSGKGVLNAVYNVNNSLNDLLNNQNVFEQEKIDQMMISEDGTKNKSRFGANAILSVSLAAATAAAKAKKLELYQYLAHFFETIEITLPIPLINVINGGKHAENSTDIQEYMLIPYGFSKFSEALRASSEVYQELKKLLKTNSQNTAVGDEGGFVPNLKTNEEPLQLLLEAISNAGYIPGSEFGLGIDSAASEFFKDNEYYLKKEERKLSTEQMVEYYLKLSKDYPLVSFEDHFQEDDWQGFINLNKIIGKKIQTIGDDLYVTNVERLKKGIATEATNAILIKVNQIGTLTETINAIKVAKEANMEVIVSHRSGETEDSFIADLVVAAGTGQIKAGSVCRSERLAKYNRLLEIENKEREALYYDFPYKVIDKKS